MTRFMDNVTSYLTNPQRHSGLLAQGQGGGSSQSFMLGAPQQQQQQQQQQLLLPGPSFYQIQPAPQQTQLQRLYADALPAPGSFVSAVNTMAVPANTLVPYTGGAGGGGGHGAQFNVQPLADRIAGAVYDTLRDRLVGGSRGGGQ
jgi:hypothetical protein